VNESEERRGEIFNEEKKKHQQLVVLAWLGANSVSLPSLSFFLSRDLARYKIPKHFELFIDTLRAYMSYVSTAITTIIHSFSIRVR
jgi:NADH:ubiquinone oxidoreductase subunit 5 (subunit L)/multisubunit Na+/H+ antiporter MnhA subunit